LETEEEQSEEGGQSLISPDNIDNFIQETTTMIQALRKKVAAENTKTPKSTSQRTFEDHEGLYLLSL